MKKTAIILSLALITLSCSKDGFGNYPDSAGFVEYYPEEEGDKFSEFSDNPFKSTDKEPISTFSVDADGASYAIMRKYVDELGYIPGPSSVRIEEYLNYFTFDYPSPEGSDAVAMNYELGKCPWNTDHKLLRIGLKGKTLASYPCSNYVFLVDVSGSMDSSDKIDLLKSGLMMLVDRLRPNDKIAIITYSGKVQKVLESTPVSQGETIKNAISKLTAKGYTNGGDAIKMAYAEARENFVVGGNNRVIIGTDGDFNVGITDTDDLLELVQNEAESGIYLTVCGFGTGNLNDSMMEKISNKGNGTYEYIDGEKQMVKVFVNETNKFYSVADDVKIQVEFNPAKVAQYRLIGYENRVMSNSDFENDEKDAAEIASGQTVTALYELVLTEGQEEEQDSGQGNGRGVSQTDTPNDGQGNSQVDGFALLRLRYKEGLSNPSQEFTLPVETLTEKASDEFNFAASIATFGMILRQSPYKGNATFDMAISLGLKGLTFDPHNYRSEYMELVEKASKLY